MSSLKPYERKYKRVVIKIGSSLFCSTQNALDLRIFDDIARQFIQLVEEGAEVAVVSSGAIALGMSILGLTQRPKALSSLQAAAALGQNELMNAYNRFLQRRGFHAAQILLTWEDFNERTRYLNAKNTLGTLLEYHTKCGKKPTGQAGRIVPIINENDTVSTDEIKFGDNDRLSALVASLISADLLIILSDVDGLLDENKSVIPVVAEITAKIKALASPTQKKTCVGGMITKIEAAKIAVESGIPCVIANGRRKNIIQLVTNEPSAYGTLFVPKKGLAARQRWIAFGSKPKGTVKVDTGARQALMNNKSLLAVGITGIEGDFEPGEIVRIVDDSGSEFARGKICISRGALEKAKGGRYHKEIIHCDDIVIA
ncbi:MAG: glutamate 5-kinase [Candidatus Omnitrophota bacterium]|jgi:glutamate 5-kinase